MPPGSGSSEPLPIRLAWAAATRTDGDDERRARLPAAAPGRETPRARGELLLLALWFLGGLYSSVAIIGWRTALGFDAHAYWLAWHHSSMYGLPPNTADAYLYSPAFAQLIWPLAQLPWPLFVAAWAVAGFALYAWLLRPLGRTLAAPLLLFCLPQAMVGNIWPLLAVVLVFGFRRPGLWAFRF